MFALTAAVLSLGEEEGRYGLIVRAFEPDLMIVQPRNHGLSCWTHRLAYKIHGLQQRPSRKRTEMHDGVVTLDVHSQDAAVRCCRI